MPSWLNQLLMVPQAPAADFPFVSSDVARYHGCVNEPDDAVIDDQTWRDLLLDDYTQRLAQQTSIFGQQILHDRLRRGAARSERLPVLLDDAAQRDQLQQACHGLREADSEVATELFGAARIVSPRWSHHLRWLPLGFVVLLVAGIVTGWWPLWLGAGAAWIALMAIQMAFHEAAGQWERQLRTLQQMLRAHGLLARLDLPLAEPFRAGAAQAAAIQRSISRSALNAAPGMREYGDWVALNNIRHYFASRDAVLAQRDFLRSSFQLVGALDADLALARHLAQQPRHCWAERGADDDIMFDQVAHPLLQPATPLSLTLEGQGAFISGQNGIGKSTLLRTVGLNLIVARAFGFCYADAARVPPLPVYSSMQSEDALSSGESLYVAELRRAQELLALAGRRRALFVIDEIFRGTNHLESISAAAAVLHTLAAAGTVLVSSHNLVLAPLLADCLAPLCVSAPDGDRSRLRVAPGVLAETNGIALLAARGFGAAIEDKARRVHGWLSGYLAHPADCAGVLLDAMPSAAPK